MSTLTASPFGGQLKLETSVHLAQAKQSGSAVTNLILG
jgi:hypothetical protein